MTTTGLGLTAGLRVSTTVLPLIEMAVGVRETPPTLTTKAESGGIEAASSGPVNVIVRLVPVVLSEDGETSVRAGFVTVSVLTTGVAVLPAASEPEMRMS